MGIELSRLYTSYAAAHRTRLGGNDVEIVSPAGTHTTAGGGNRPRSVSNSTHDLNSPQAAGGAGGRMTDVVDEHHDDIEAGTSTSGVKFSVGGPAYAPIIPSPPFSSQSSQQQQQQQHGSSSGGDHLGLSTVSAHSVASSSGGHPPMPAVRRFTRGQTTTTSALHFTPMTLAFRNLSYTVTLQNGEQIELLKGINGYFKPGTMTALMGSSGAGKTTLLDVLGGRKTSGIVRGELYVNQAPIEKKADKKAYLRVLGYVEQMDLHSPFTTVFEALTFSARLRLSADIPVADQEKFIQEVIDLLEMNPIKKDVVGRKGEGLSTEQRKRLTIGVELVANPSLIFLDEPTSGLDSRAALIVIRVIKKLAMTGRTVICTIHQPSLVLFEHFDNLLLLRRGGETVFFGPLGYDSSCLIDYLQSIPGTPRFRQGENPATWMLECIGAGTSNTEKCDYAAEFKNSALAQKCLDELADLIPALGDQRDVDYISPQGKANKKSSIVPPKNVSLLTATWLCTRRAVTSYNRLPQYNLLRPGLCLIMALVFATVYGPQDKNNFQGLFGSVAAVVLATAFIGIVDSSSAIEVHGEEKASFARERFSKMYPIISYAISYVIAEIPWIALHSILFAVPFYYLCGYYNDLDKFGFFVLYQFLYNVWSSYFGQLLSALFTKQVAQVVWNTLAFLLINFIGFTRKPPNIPIYWKFLYWTLPSHYAFEGIAMTQWHGATDLTSTPFGPLPTGFLVEDYILEKGFKYSRHWSNVGILVGFILATIFCLWAALRFGKLQSR